MTIIFRVYYVLYFSAYFESRLADLLVYYLLLWWLHFPSGINKMKPIWFYIILLHRRRNPNAKEFTANKQSHDAFQRYDSKKQIYCWFIPLWSAYFYLFVNSTILYSPVFYKTYKCNETSAFASAVCSFIKSDLTINVLTDCIRDPFHVPCTRSYNHWHKIPLLPPCSAY